MKHILENMVDVVETNKSLLRLLFSCNMVSQNINKTDLKVVENYLNSEEVQIVNKEENKVKLLDTPPQFLGTILLYILLILLEYIVVTFCVSKPKFCGMDFSTFSSKQSKLNEYLGNLTPFIFSTRLLMIPFSPVSLLANISQPFLVTK